MPLLNPSFSAGEDLLPSIFVIGDASNPFTCHVAANATYPILGVVHDGTRVAPTPESAETHAAHEGETVRVHGEGDTCRLKINDTVAAFALVTATTSGYGATHSTGYYGAIALEDGVAGDLIRVQVKFGYKA